MASKTMHSRVPCRAACPKVWLRQVRQYLWGTQTGGMKAHPSESESVVSLRSVPKVPLALHGRHGRCPSCCARRSKFTHSGLIDELFPVVRPVRNRLVAQVALARDKDDGYGRATDVADLFDPLDVSFAC